MNRVAGFTLGRIGLKTALLWLVVNALFVALAPLPTFGQLSLYNTLLTGRDRFPYGDGRAYSVTPASLEALFASHVISRPKSEQEYRVVIIGDSSVWGMLLEPEDTLAGQLNHAQLTAPDGRKLQFYNLGYPTMSLTKDQLLLDYALHYEPDLVVWLITLESFWRAEQTALPLIQANRERLGLPAPALTLLDKTIWGQRRNLADLLRLQLYAIPYTATGIDQVYPDHYTPRQNDFAPDDTWHEFSPEKPFTRADLAFESFLAGLQRAESLPILVVNEPIFISDGQNSHLRYNFFYPRWAYQAYRGIIAEVMSQQPVYYRDWWRAVPAPEFTDSAVHLTFQGTTLLSEAITQDLEEILTNPTHARRTDSP